jgi:ribosome-binding protein aMBF1 (putative translation factor)
MLFPPATFTLRGESFVIVPRDHYEWLCSDRSTPPPGTVDAIDAAERSIAASLRKARETARLTQGELAKKLKKSQATVSMAERGAMQVGQRYIRAVLKACGLPKDWSAGGAVKRRAP